MEQVLVEQVVVDSMEVVVVTLTVAKVVHLVVEDHLITIQRESLVFPMLMELITEMEVLLLKSYNKYLKVVYVNNGIKIF